MSIIYSMVYKHTAREAVLLISLSVRKSSHQLHTDPTPLYIASTTMKLLTLLTLTITGAAARGYLACNSGTAGDGGCEAKGENTYCVSRLPLPRPPFPMLMISAVYLQHSNH